MSTESVRNHTQETAGLCVTTRSSFMGPFTISSVNVALLIIQKEFGINAIELNWIAMSYLLSNGRFNGAHSQGLASTSASY